MHPYSPFDYYTSAKPCECHVSEENVMAKPKKGNKISQNTLEI